MSRIHKISFTIIFIALVISMILGITTRLSYKNIDENNAIFTPHPEYNSEEISKLNISSVLSQLDSAEFAFLVTIENTEYTYQTTKTTAHIDKLIKGTISNNSDIIIYETNFISYRNDTAVYYSPNSGFINNLMQKGKKYLVFADKVDYADEFEKELNMDEYFVNFEKLTLYSFPIESEIKHLDNNLQICTYSDVKNYDYICYTEEDAEKLTEIKDAVLDHYLG